MSCWRRFWRDETGQDLVEYALLTLFVGLVGMAVWSGIVSVIGDNYNGYNNQDTGVPSLWESPNP
jgi:Flp pilus assembly pilin Flp